MVKQLLSRSNRKSEVQVSAVSCILFAHTHSERERERERVNALHTGRDIWPQSISDKIAKDVLTRRRNPRDRMTRGCCYPIECGEDSRAFSGHSAQDAE